MKESIRGKDGYFMRRHNVSTLCYNDDAVLLTNNEDNLQRLLQQLNITGKIYNMNISTDKIKTMVINKQPISCKLELDRSVVQQVMKFKHLGIEATNQRDFMEVQQQALTTTQVTNYLNPMIWRNKYLNNGSKVRIYKVMVRPVLTYSTETRADIKKAKEKVGSVEVKILRKISNATLRDKQTKCPSATDGMERFACPTPDRQGRYHCIDDHVLCDGFIDCPSGEDEDRQSCMFYKTTKAHLDVLADALLRWARGR
ncbi:hypothetical protein Trydic_g21672 [Trypoxylus dichotomus]